MMICVVVDAIELVDIGWAVPAVVVPELEVLDC
jgi:hypothetical protein